MPPATPNLMGSPPSHPPAPPAPCAELPAALLSFENVSKRYPDGGLEIVALDRVSFELAAGAALGVLGERCSGKSTLLRLAAAIEPPDGGSIRFDGQDITRLSASERARLLRGGVTLLAAADWLPSPGEIVLEHVAMSLGCEGLSMREAKRRALATLDAVGVSAVGAAQSTASLSAEQRARVMLARALVGEPRLLLVDEPAPMPRLEDHERFCATLRRVTRERGIALLVASEDMRTLGGLGPPMSLSAGELLSTGDDRGTLVQGPWRAAASGPA
jgi:ABC-type methionine transport system ATPase subunit